MIIKTNNNYYLIHTVYIVTVQARTNLAIDERDLSRSFEHYFYEYNLRPDATIRVFPHMLEQYPSSSGGEVYIYASVFL